MSLPILVDSYYFGHALYHARRRAKLTRDEVTKILGLLSRQLHKYENGRELIPESVLYRLFYNGLLMLSARRYNKNNGDK